MTTKKELAEIKRGIREQDAWRTVERRCYSIFKHNQEKAAELHRESEIDFDLVLMRQHAHAVMGNICHWCLKKLTPKNFSFDHEIAVTRGGTFAWDNMMVICSGCNHTKGTLSREEFMKLHEFLHTLLADARADILRRLGCGGQFIR